MDRTAEQVFSASTGPHHPPMANPRQEGRFASFTSREGFFIGCFWDRFFSDLVILVSLQRSAWEDVMAKRRNKSQAVVPVETKPDTDRLLGDLRHLIDSARDQVAQAVNAGLVLLYWGVGERIRREILGEQRAAYGEQIVLTVSRQLTAEYGRGFTAKALWRMIQFVEAFSNKEIVAALSRQLGWSHFVELIPLSELSTQEEGNIIPR
jgi:hypothetical protein